MVIKSEVGNSVSGEKCKWRNVVEKEWSSKVEVMRGESWK